MLSPVSPSVPHSSSHSEGPRGVATLKLELPESTTNVLRTLMYLEKMLTQEELPAEPGSGSEGSSTVESTLTTSMRPDTALLVTALTDGLECVLRSAAKAGRHPYHHGRTRSQHRLGKSCHYRQQQHDKPPATQVRPTQTYKQTKDRAKRKRVGHMLHDRQSTGPMKKRAIEIGAATVERTTRGRYEWRDAELGKRKRDDEQDREGKDGSRGLRPRGRQCRPQS